MWLFMECVSTNREDYPMIDITDVMYVVDDGGEMSADDSAVYAMIMEEVTVNGWTMVY